MALPDPPPDPDYAQFLRWREETAVAPPDPQAALEVQQFHLFKQFLQFWVWRGAQEEREAAQQEQAQHEQPQREQVPPQVARTQLISALQSYADKRQRQRPPRAPHTPTAPRPAFRVAPSGCVAWAVVLFVVLIVGGVLVYSLLPGPSSPGLLPFDHPSLPLAYEQYTDASEALHFIGVITNTTSSPVQNLAVQATLYDSKNRVDASEDDYLGDVTLNPGQRVGFDLRISAPPLKWVRADLQVTVRGGTFQHVSGLHISDDAMASGDSGGEVVRGIVHNDGPDDAYPATVLVTGYDERGRVVDIGDSDTTDRDGIDAGQSSPFEVHLWRRDVKIAHYETLVYARGK